MEEFVIRNLYHNQYYYHKYGDLSLTENVREAIKFSSENSAKNFIEENKIEFIDIPIQIDKIIILQ